MFATIIIERQALQLEQLPGVVVSWLQIVGAMAFVILAISGLVRLFSRRPPTSGSPPSRLLSGSAQGLALLVSFSLFLVGGALLQVLRSGRKTTITLDTVHLFLAAGGLVAILAVCAPLLLNLTQISPRRVLALSRLSFKEAIRRKVLLAFSLILVGFLFAGWFLTTKPEHQLSTYVRFVSFLMSVFLLFIAGLLAAFGIPSDLKTQTMYTIVTKPVERFEIVLGRCIGYTALMTLVLAVMSLFSLIYVAREIDKEAKDESYKARVCVFGDLKVVGGKSVGREWEYRQYIAGGATNDEAIWTFPRLPSDLGTHTKDPWVPCEFSFDIFRTTKGKEGRAIRCSFIVTNWKWDESNRRRYEDDLNELQKKDIDPNLVKTADAYGWSADQRQAIRRSELADRYGIYELQSKEIKDYHTLSVAVPLGMFAGLNDFSPGKDNKPAMQIQVRCVDATQYLGVAQHDLYLLNAERPFEVNFFKGSVGLWCRLVLVIVVAVTLSTYLSGIISFLTTMFLYGGGLIFGFIQEVALGRTQGGGPFESLIRLARGANLMTQMEDTATIGLLRIFDFAFRIFLYPLLLVIPSVERFDLSNYVAQGFDVSVGQIIADNLVPLAGYLIPWIVLAYYLMRSREIASTD